MTNNKALFIINPISGTGKQDHFLDDVAYKFGKASLAYETVYTEYQGHATELSRNASKEFDVVVAVGGDGTVNEVAKGLIGSKACMGIVPVGSGNGLARHLRLPMKLKEALDIIIENQVINIDTATLNGNYFVNVAGIGFDAHIAHLFAKTKKRGPIPYVTMATVEFQKYQSQNYEVIVEGQEYNFKAFLISFANSSQFGNNAYISPNAVINDGLLDVCLMSDFPKVEAGQLAIKLFNKRLDKSKYMKIVRATHILVRSDKDINAHIDGEPINLTKEVEIILNKGSLKVIHNTNRTTIDLIQNKIKNL
ncbi:MAG: diacylglycerol kinase family lipid kinase [Salinivirgaceae bacterium]|jgi:diacylglycerol kinase (ATP)|nr:diacylglycerol kinase family lipid kinase [Salinivirgaceae bacterium]